MIAIGTPVLTLLHVFEICQKILPQLGDIDSVHHDLVLYIVYVRTLWTKPLVASEIIRQTLHREVEKRRLPRVDIISVATARY